VGAAFPVAQAGRALSAFNLLIFAGVFGLQWGIGLAIDGLRALGLAEQAAYRAAFAGFGLWSLAAYLWFVVGRVGGGAGEEGLRIMQPTRTWHAE
jgi:hypothetical protein